MHPCSGGAQLGAFPRPPWLSRELSPGCVTWRPLSSHLGRVCPPGDLGKPPTLTPMLAECPSWGGGGVCLSSKRFLGKANPTLFQEVLPVLAPLLGPAWVEASG